MFGPARLLDPKLIPSSLWDANAKKLRLPPALAEIYVQLIDRCDLRALADARDPKNPPVGGINQEATDAHFAQAFDGSVARVQLAVLNPKNHVPHASDAFISSLAGNRVCLTDAPCGAGAAAFGFLATIAELRARSILPREPLHISLIGAEISGPARGYAEAMLAELRSRLEDQAIFVEAKFLPWNVTDALSNTDLIRQITLASAHGPKRLLVVANFSGFLEKEKRRKDAAPQLEELFRHVSGDDSVAIWIEPATNHATGSGGLFTWLSNLVEQRWHRFARLIFRGDAPEQVHTSHARFQLPLFPDRTVRVNLALIPLSLIRQR